MTSRLLVLTVLLKLLNLSASCSHHLAETCKNKTVALQVSKREFRCQFKPGRKDLENFRANSSCGKTVPMIPVLRK